MPRSPAISQRSLATAVDVFRKLPRPVQALAAVLGLVGLIFYAVGGRNHAATPADVDASAVVASQPATAKDGGSFLFCFWNVENLFDDRDDNRQRIDREYDVAFAENEELRKLKYDRLTEALLKMNGGRGPDILACAEIESVRTAEMLMGALNAKIKDPAQKYKAFAMKNLNAGRHIAPCVISRVPLSQISTKLHGGNLRILETHLYVNNYDLCILATHWTSQLRQQDGSNGERGRENYAKMIHTVTAGIAKKKPDADILLCGDFNETPDGDAVTKFLLATGDKSKVTPSADAPRYFDLMAGKPADKFGTIWYGGKPLIYDQICVSAGMLDDAGWACDPDSVKTVTEGLTRPGATRREPWRFGDPGSNARPAERGYSDHFPVVVKLTVKPAAAAAKPD